MVKKSASILWAFFVIMTLIISQGQMVLAKGAPDSAVVSPDTSVSVSSNSTDVEPPERGSAYAPPTPVNDCVLAVTGVAMTEPVPPGYPIAAAGRPYFGLDTLTDGNGDPIMQDPRAVTHSEHVDVKRAVGDQLIWVLMFENASYDSGCSEGTVTNFHATMSVNGTEISIPMNYPGPTGQLQPHELAWAEVDYTIPSNAPNPFRIIIWGEGDISSYPGEGTSDRDTDDLIIEGPGFDIVSFTATPDPFDPANPDRQVPGGLVNFKLTIKNTRLGVPITGISVTADDLGNLGSVQFASACTDYPFSGAGGIWKTVVGDAEITTSLDPDAEAYCEINGVSVPSTAPIPPTYSIGGMVTATDGNVELDLTKPATSDLITVSQAEISVTKRVSQIERGGSVIWPNGSDPMPPVTAGDAITYLITVKNTGDVTVNTLEITDSLAGYLVPSTTTLAPDEEVSVEARHIVTNGSQDPLVNHVTARAKSTVVPFNTVDAEGSAIVDVLDSALEATLSVEDPITGDPLTSVPAGTQVRYRLDLHNAGATQINSLSYVAVAPPLHTVGTPPTITPNYLVPGGTLTLTWLYDVTAADSDPLISTIRVRGITGSSMVIYGQDQASLDLATPGLNVSVAVLDPPTDTILRGATAVYEITVTNTDSVNPLCEVVVNQFRRDPDTGTEYPVQLNIPMDWPTPASPGRLNAGEAAMGTTTYLVTGADKDPLDMVFEAIATSDCSGFLPEPLIDRTNAVLDISDAQVNAVLVPDLGVDGVAEVGDPITFTFVAQNVGAVTLENLSATWCIVHRPDDYCGLPFDPGYDLNPTSIGSFEDTTGRFTYTIEQPPDADATPFIAEVTMTGTDNKGNQVSIKTATEVPIATTAVLLNLSAPKQAVEGDTISVGFTITNSTGVSLSDIHLYSLLEPDPGDPYGYREVAVYPTILGTDGQNVVSGTFDYVVKPGVGIKGQKLTLIGRVVGETETGSAVITTGTVDVEIVPMMEVIKTGDPVVVAGQGVNYAITIINHSLSQTLTITDYQDNVLAGYGVSISNGDFSTWSGTPGVLQPGEFVSGTFAIPNPPGVDPDPNPLVNVVVVTGTRPDGANVFGSDSWEVAIACPVYFGFQVFNKDDQPDDILGEWLEWHVQVTNVSQSSITFGGISESLFFGGLVPGSNGLVLGPGQTYVLTLPDLYAKGAGWKQITADLYGPGDDYMSDTLSANFSETGGVTSCVQAFDYPIYSPILITKDPSVNFAFPGQTVTYTIKLKNLAEANDAPYYDRYDVTLSDPMFGGTILMPYGGGAPAEHGWLEPGEEVSTTKDYTIQETDPDELTNTARVEFKDVVSGITIFTEAEATVVTENPLQLTKTPSVRLATPGTTITYTYTITNVSDYSAYGITLNDLYDLSGDNDEVVNIIPGMTGGQTINLEPGESFVKLDVPYNIPLTAPDPLKNTATVQGTVLSQTITNSITVSVDLEDPDIAITKYARFDDGSGDPVPGEAGIVPETTDPDGLPQVDDGTVIHYCFLIQNNGGSSTFVDNIVLNDTMFPGAIQTAFTGAVADQLGHSDSLPEDDPLYGTDRLRGGEAVDFCLGAIAITNALGDPVYNLVSLEGTTSGGSPTYSEDELAIDVKGTALLVTKIPSPPLAYVGDSVTYTIMLYNDAALPIVNIDLTDTRAGGGTLPVPSDAITWPDPAQPGRLEPGEQATYVYSYTIQNTDPDPLENVAEGTGFLDESPNPPDEWTQVSDSTRSVVAITASQLLVNKIASPTIVQASPDDCEVKTGIGDDPAKPACRLVHYTISVTNVGSLPVTDLTALDTHFDAETGGVVNTLPSGAVFSDTDLDPLETAFLFYDLPVPTASQLLANPELDPFLNTIEVSGTIFEDQVQGTVTATADAAVDILQPNVRITKSAATLAAAPGQTVTYNIVIQNVGSAGDTLTGLRFRDLYYQGDPPVETVVSDIDLDAVCPNNDPDICPFVYGAEPYGDYDNDPLTPDTANPKEGLPYNPTDGIYPGGEPGLMVGERLYDRGTIRLQVPADWTGNEFTNIAEISGSVSAVSVIDRSSTTIDIRPEGIEVEKLASVTTAAVGDPVLYTVRVTNIGTTAIERLVIADNAMDGDPDKSITVEDFPDGADPAVLGPNETYELQYVHTITADGGDPYVNRVTVTGFSAVGAVVNVAQSAVDVEDAVLLVDKYACAGDGSAQWNGDPSTMLDPCNLFVVTGDANPDVVTYYLHFQNPSGVPITNIQVTDSLGDVGAIPWPYSDGNGSGLGTTEGVDNELWWMYTYTVQPGDADPLHNIVTVTGDAQSGTVEVTASVDIALVTGDLLLTKTAVSQAVVGQTITYTLTVENLSDSIDLIDVNVVDPLSPYGTASIPGCYVKDMAPLGSKECSFDHTISLADGSPLINVATASGFEGLSTVSDTATHTVQIVTGDLAVTKTADTTVAAIGQDVVYTYQIENTGLTDITQLVVEDTDASVTFSPPWPTSLGPGEIAVRTWTKTISAQDPDPYANTVLVTGEIFGQPVSAEATETVYIAAGDLVVTNVPSASYVLAGNPVTFTYVVTNYSTFPITGLAVSDTPCGDLSGQLSSTVLAASSSVTLYCTVPSAELPGPIVSTVNVNGLLNNSTPISDSATSEVAVTSGGLVVTKTADRTVAQPGDTIQYTVEVTNIGDVTLTDFVVDDPMVPGLAPVPPDTLQPQQSFIMTGSYVVAVTDQSVSNVVTVTATDLAGTQQFEDSDSAMVAVLEDPNATLALTKQVIPQRALPGEDVTYIFTVRNISTTTQEDPVLSDPGLGVFDFLPNIAPSGVVTRTYQMTVPADTTDPTLTNTAIVFVGETLEDTADATLLVDLISLTKEADVNVVAPDDTVTYTFTLHNNSTATVSAIDLLDPVIDDPDNNGVWNDPHLNVSIDGSTTAYITATITVPTDYSGATFDNTAQVLVQGQVVDEASLVLYVPSNALALTKSADPLSVVPGDQITYTFTIDNFSGAPMDNVTLSDPVVDAYGSYLDPLVNETVPTEGITVTATVTVPLSWTDPTFDNTATLLVSGDPIAEDSASVDVVITDLILSKTADTEMALRGDTITYTFTIVNNGTDPLDNVTLEDDIVDNPIYNGVWNGTVPNPLPLGTTEITASIVVPLDYEGATLDNTAQLLVDGSPPDPAVDATASVIILDNALTLDKTVLPATAQPGDTVTYTCTITNNAPVAIGGVTLEDDIVDDPTYNGVWSGAVPDPLPVGDTVITATVDIPLEYAEPALDNTANLLVNGVPVATDSATVTILSQELNLIKTASPDPVAPGDTITYTFTIQNNGEVPVAGVTIGDPLIDASGSWVDTVPDPLPVGDTIVTATLPVTLDMMGSDLENTAQLLVDTNPVDEASASVTVLGLTLTKTASPNPVAPGGTITYTFTIDNPGTLEVPGVTLVDSIIDASGTWNGTVPDPLPAGTTEITATLVAPDEAPTEVENIAQLLVDEVQVDEASVTVRVLEPGLFVTINEVYQLVPNTADPANPIHVNPPLPLQTGRPVYIAFTMLNSGSETLNNPTYQTRSKAQYQLDTQWQVFSCSRLSPATMPESLAPGDQVDVVCQFTPPVALAQYFELDGAGLYRNLEVIGAGKTAADQTLTGSDTEDITLVDLKLGVDLSFPVVGTPPGTNVQAQIVIYNRGASPIGCDGTVVAGAACHLVLTTNDPPTGTFGSAINAAASTLTNVVLWPVNNDPTKISQITLGPVTFLTLPLKPYTVVVAGGYYSEALEAKNWLDYYVVYADDTEDFRGDLSVVVTADPNPPTVGEDITYTVTVTNTGQFTVNSLTATYEITSASTAALLLDGIMLAGENLSPAAQTTGSILLSPTVIAPGQIATGTLTKTEDQTGTYVFTVTAIGTALVASDTTATGSIELTPLGTEELNPNETEPTLDKQANVTEVQPGDAVVWTITVRNGSTSAFTGVVMEDTVPDTVPVDSVDTSQGSAVSQNNVVTAQIGDLGPGETATVTINTTVAPDVSAPSSIVNSACVTHDGGGQVCKTVTINVAPGVETLPSTGVGMDSWREWSW